MKTYILVNCDGPILASDDQAKLQAKIDEYEAIDKVYDDYQERKYGHFNQYKDTVKQFVERNDDLIILDDAPHWASSLFLEPLHQLGTRLKYYPKDPYSRESQKERVLYDILYNRPDIKQRFDVGRLTEAIPVIPPFNEPEPPYPKYYVGDLEIQEVETV
jgi:hypothetical protein